MKDLSKLTNEELINVYLGMQAQEDADYQMDGSGDCGHLIAKNYEPVYEAFHSEFDKREIKEDSCMANDYSDEMPY
jgi:hypothetical protein